jgi:NAD-dependent dihydropyrimidine dehydrogenase PreA subunit
MKRRIIEIDRSRCTGCGSCIPDCPEGALRVIEGKAALVSDLYCDGLGACVGMCPEGAISVVEREADAYDERAVMAGITPQGKGVIRAHLEHLLGHGEQGLYRQAIAYLEEQGIPVPEHRAGAEPEAPSRREKGKEVPSALAQSETAPAAPSALQQWPVQLRLVNPASPWFEDADLLIAADCAPFAYAGFHPSFLEGRRLLIRSDF